VQPGEPIPQGLRGRRGVRDGRRLNDRRGQAHHGLRSLGLPRRLGRRRPVPCACTAGGYHPASPWTRSSIIGSHVVMQSAVTCPMHGVVVGHYKVFHMSPEAAGDGTVRRGLRSENGFRVDG
jgi:hypothetical protein